MVMTTEWQRSSNGGSGSTLEGKFIVHNDSKDRPLCGCAVSCIFFCLLVRQRYIVPTYLQHTEKRGTTRNIQSEYLHLTARTIFSRSVVVKK